MCNMALRGKRPREDGEKPSGNKKTKVNSNGSARERNKSAHESHVPAKGASKAKFGINKTKANKYAKPTVKSSAKESLPAKKLTSKEAHAQAKEKRTERKKNSNEHYETTVEMKKLWEDLRRHDLSKDKRLELCNTVMVLIRGKEKDFIYAHDTTRIFQTLCKYAPTNIRSEMFNSLKDSLLDMVKSKYSVFFVRSMLRKGTKEEKAFIIDKLMNSARRLLIHKVAGSVVEFAYNMYANARQRLAFSQQFYGPSFVLLNKEEHLPLDKVLAALPEKKPFILKYMKEALESIVQKEALGFTLVHNLFCEYFAYSDSVERQAMAECLQEHICQILHTREGAKAAMFTVWFSSAKGRKLILKQLKNYLDKVMTEEYGHMLLLAIFDSIDDTKLVSKLILTHVADNVDSLVNDKWGRHVLLYLLGPRNPRYFNKEVRDLLALGDGNPFSKKDKELRQKELLTEVSAALLTYVVGHVPSLISKEATGGHKWFLHGVLCTAVGDKSEAVLALVSCYNKPHAPDHPLEDKALGFIVRGLLSADDTGTYAQSFTEGISAEVFTSFLYTDRGCLFLTDLLKSAKGDVKKGLKASLLKQALSTGKKQHQKLQGKPYETLMALLSTTEDQSQT